VGCALASLIVHANARTWWTKPVGYQLPRFAQIVNGAPNSLLIAPVSVDLLTMSTLLEPAARILPVRNADSLTVPNGYATVFVLGERKDLLARVRSDGRFSVVPVDGRQQLWRLQH
jgi:hypothetical protein